MNQQKKVSAVVLAGGFGTRLSPITDSKPKPLVRILDTTVLENILCKVMGAGIEKITVSTHYQAEKIEKLCKEKYPAVVCKRECVPLGTAGGTKYCADCNEEEILVVSGDAVFDFSLEEAMDFHFQNENDVTIVTCHKENPTEYGVVVTDEENNVVEFCEKPSWKRVKSDLVNTGIYLLSKTAIDEIPDNMQYDFSKNLFPRLMREGKRIKSFTPHGFWCDIGTFDEYYECNVFAALGKLSCIPNIGQTVNSLRESGVDAEDGIYVSQDCMIGKNVKLSRASVVCQNTHIGDSCDVSFSIIGKGTRLGKGCSVSGAIIGENVSVGENCLIPEGCIVGDESRIADGTVIKKNERFAPSSNVSGKDGKDLMFSNREKIFVDEGLVRFDLSEACSNVIKLAKATCASYAKSEKMSVFLSVMCNENSLHLKNAFVSGLQGENANIFDCGTGNIAMCSYVTSHLFVDVGVYVAIENEKVCIRFFDSNGRVIDDDTERKISKVFGLVGEEVNAKPMEKIYGSISCVPAKEMYYAYLSDFAKRLLEGCDLKSVNVFVEGSDENRRTVLENILSGMSAQLALESTRETLNVSKNSDGTRATVRLGNTILDHEHVCAVVIKNKHVLGIEEMYVDENAPSVLKNMAENSNKKAGKLAEDFLLCNADLAVIALLSALAKRGEGFDVLYGEIPLFEIYTDEYIGEINRGETVEKLSRMYNDSKNNGGDGIKLSMADGNVTVIPNRAKGLKIIAEAQSMETARELCIKIGDIIKSKE